MYPYQNPSLSPEERAQDLLSRMTLDEKVGQLSQRLYGFRCFTREGDTVTLTDEFREEVARYSGLGALYGLHRADPWSGRTFETGLDGALSPKAANMVQKYVISHSRLGIPVLLSTECPHGHQALDGWLLPVNLAAGASFCPELVREAAKVSGRQLSAMGIHLALVSALDVLRDPRWGRSEECFGEDPYLAGQMAAAVVEGIRSQGVAVVAKHLCAQGETTGGVNASAARIGPRELREIHLPPVKACVEAEAEAFMAAYNEIDGTYCHANRWLLTDLLRGEYGFRGFVMSDGVAIDQLDGVTGDRAASGALAVSSGVDMGLWDTGIQKLPEAVARGLISREAIDTAAKRVLTLKFRLGLFENPYVPEDTAWQSCNDENYSQGRRLAEHTPVLLKNDGCLPLAPGTKLLVTGPNADNIYNQLGDYTPPLRPGTGTTVRRGLEALTDVRYVPGCSLFGGSDGEIQAAVDAAKDCDCIVAVVGGSSSRFALRGAFDDNGAMKSQEQLTMDCGENVDSAGLKLPGRQLELLARLKETGKPLVTVVIAGRPYEMAEISRLSDGILYSFYPGPLGGEVIGKILMGLLEPAGRLSVSLPDDAARLPVYYNAKDSYRPMTYYDGIPAVTYGFGSGLSYTSFRFRLDSAPTADALSVTATVTNTGSRPGWAVPQLYLHRTQGIATSRVRQLCGFCKRFLAPGETVTVEIPIGEEALTQFDGSGKAVTVPGRIQWFLCDSGETKLSGAFIL